MKSHQPIHLWIAIGILGAAMLAGCGRHRDLPLADGNSNYGIESYSAEAAALYYDYLGRGLNIPGLSLNTLLEPEVQSRLTGGIIGRNSTTYDPQNPNINSPVIGAKIFQNGNQGMCGRESDNGGVAKNALPRVAATDTATGPYSQKGPYSVSKGKGKGYHFYYPSTQQRVPLLVFGSGFGGLPQFYDQMLQLMTTYGFAIAASQSPIVTKSNMKSVIDSALKSYGSKIDASKIGVFGHSFGGGTSIEMAIGDPRVKAMVGMSPYCPPVGGKLLAPALLMTGDDEVLDSLTQFDALIGTIFAGSVKSAIHWEPMGTGHRMRPPAIAWFLAHLKGDATALGYFKGSTCVMCKSSDWTVRQKGL